MNPYIKETSWGTLIFPVIAFVIVAVSVLNHDRPVPEPMQETSAGRPTASDRIGDCPIILGHDGDAGVCWYNPDGTIHAYRDEGWNGWILVE